MTTALELSAPDGPCEAYLGVPPRGSGPGVLFIMDAIGPRPQIAQMVDRVASWGYTVLAPNLFYRSGTLVQLAPQRDLREPGAREEFFAGIKPRMVRLGTADLDADLRGYLAALHDLASVEGDEVGVVGYCMGARLATKAAGLDPHVVAVCGFHGGGLVTDAPDSPHRSLADAKAEFVFGHATSDPSMPPDAVEALGRALADAGLAAVNDVYDGPHGFAMADTSAYDEAAAERSFDAMREVFSRRLGRDSHG